MSPQTPFPFPGLIADGERLVISFLRSNAYVTAIAGDRIYSSFPSKATFPLALVQRVGGTPPFSQPLVLDEVALQIDAYGGPKVLAEQLMATVRAVLNTLEGQARPEGTCSAVRFGACRYMPDETFKPAQPRYIADVAVYVRAGPPA